jgi:hypothetical protein
MPSILKAISYLEKGDHMIIHIHYSEYVVEQFQKIRNILKHIGMIYFYDNVPEVFQCKKNLKYILTKS